MRDAKKNAAAEKAKAKVAAVKARAATKLVKNQKRQAMKAPDVEKITPSPYNLILIKNMKIIIWMPAQKAVENI